MCLGTLDEDSRHSLLIACLALCKLFILRKVLKGGYSYHARVAAGEAEA